MITSIYYTVTPLEDSEISPFSSEIDFEASNEEFFRRIYNLVSNWYPDASITADFRHGFGPDIYADSDIEDEAQAFEEIDLCQLDVQEAQNLIYEWGDFWRLTHDLTRPSGMC